MAAPAFLGQEVYRAAQTACHALRGRDEDLPRQQREQKRRIGALEGKAAAKRHEIWLPLRLAMADRIAAGFQQGAGQVRLAAERKGRRGGHQQKIALARRSGAAPRK
jgi:hypothetical protein